MVVPPFHTPKWSFLVGKDMEETPIYNGLQWVNKLFFGFREASVTVTLSHYILVKLARRFQENLGWWNTVLFHLARKFTYNISHVDSRRLYFLLCWLKISKCPRSRQTQTAMIKSGMFDGNASRSIDDWIHIPLPCILRVYHIQYTVGDCTTVGDCLRSIISYDIY